MIVLSTWYQCSIRSVALYRLIAVFQVLCAPILGLMIGIRCANTMFYCRVGNFCWKLQGFCFLCSDLLMNSNKIFFLNNYSPLYLFQIKRFMMLLHSLTGSILYICAHHRIPKLVFYTYHNNSKGEPVF
jgi:hypothetical protein